MTNKTFFDQNGRIVASITSNVGANVKQFSHLESIDGFYDAAKFYIDIETKNPIEIPVRPGEDFVFNYREKLWVSTITPERKWSEIRSERNRLLTESDWTQIGDVSLQNETEWLAYRQSLRDITQQNDPFNIVWPVKPQAI
jgi:hypothetical protein